MKSRSEILEILQNSTCTTAYHRISPIPDAPVCTDGVVAFAEAADCFWFLDVIVSYQQDTQLDPAFQVWKLTVNEDRSAVVKGCNDTEVIIITQTVPFTDFPLETVKLFLMGGVLLLPSEY